MKQNLIENHKNKLSKYEKLTIRLQHLNINDIREILTGFSNYIF